MANQPILTVQDVAKTYNLYARIGARFLAALTGERGSRRGQPFTALEGVSFTLARGEAFGVLGRNGAGKSTLLQILAGVLTPSAGTVQAPPRVAGLLELGSGFNPDFTGRENIYLNAAILGFSRAQVEARMDQILDFADIGAFIDQPVRTYSSGMFLRLAFAVSTSVEPDLMLVDEALAVGDVFYRQKCYARLNEMRRQGVAIVIVTHSVADVRQFCTRALVLDHGRTAFLGPAEEAVQHYLQLQSAGGPGRAATPTAAPAPTQQPRSARAPAGGPQDLGDLAGEWWTRPEVIDLGTLKRIETGRILPTRLLLTDTDGNAAVVFEQGQTLRVHSEYLVKDEIDTPIAGINIVNDRGVVVHGKNTLLFDLDPPAAVEAGMALRFVQEVALNLAIGDYSIGIGLADLPADQFATRGQHSQAEMDGALRTLCHVVGAAISVVLSRTPAPCLFSHYGEADLPGRQSFRVDPARQG